MLTTASRPPSASVTRRPGRNCCSLRDLLAGERPRPPTVWLSSSARRARAPRRASSRAPRRRATRARPPGAGCRRSWPPRRARSAHRRGVPRPGRLGRREGEADGSADGQEQDDATTNATPSCGSCSMRGHEPGVRAGADRAGGDDEVGGAGVRFHASSAPTKTEVLPLAGSAATSACGLITREARAGERRDEPSPRARGSAAVPTTARSRQADFGVSAGEPRAASSSIA